MFAFVLAAVRSFIHSDNAQDAFEYLLVIGGVSVIIVAAMVTPIGETIIDALVDGVCTAINTVVTIDCG